MPSAGSHSQHHHSGNGPVRVSWKLWISVVVLLAVLAASFLEPLHPLNESLLTYLDIIWWAVLLGLFLGGLIEYFVPDSFIVRFLGTDQKLSLLYAVIAGFIMSACSHGILAIAVQLYKKGAGVPAVVTFLLASPWANLPVTILLFGLFGWRAALFVCGAMVIALVTGLIFTLLDRLGWIEGSNPQAELGDTGWDRIRNFEFIRSIKGVGAGMVSLSNMVLWWIIIGVLLAALIGAYVP
ncbi:MAG: permease, partial [Hyphomicrobiales bacterium]|nr:permease [Hyphomicrobiales bacterium]